ncbi:MAG: HK97 family phage prohead protease, partial [Candidatus Micrarchaeia archaeon]
MSKIYKQNAVIKQVDTANFTIDAYVSTRDIDRDKEVILPSAWQLDKYNGIVLDSHDYSTIKNAIGKAVELFTDDTGLRAKIQYFVGRGNEKADWAWALVSAGLGSYSVGFIPIESIDGNSDDIKRIYTKVELLEISQVVVPANPQAVQDGYEKALEEYAKLLKKYYGGDSMNEIKKGVIPYHDYGIVSDESYAWDANAEVRDADVDKLKQMCAWYDEANPDVKSSYKLPHHRASDLKAVWRGVAAAMAALLGARGGVNIPDADKEGVYNHLAKHYKQFNKEPPEFHKEYTSDEEILKACGLNEEFAVKYGRVLSEANRQRIKSVVEGINSMVDNLKSLKKELEELLNLESVEQNSVSVETIKQDTKEILKILN